MRFVATVNSIPAGNSRNQETQLNSSAEFEKQTPRQSPGAGTLDPPGACWEFCTFAFSE